MSRGPRIGLQVVYRNTLELQLICKCCRRPYYPDKVWESEWDQLVLGAEKFAICSICEQSVPQGTIDDYGYRKRWLSAVRKHLAEPLKNDLKVKAPYRKQKQRA